MDSTELENRLQALADEVRDSHTDVGTCLVTILGAMENGKIDELSDAMVGFTIDTVGDLVKDDAVKRAMFKAILRESLTKVMEQK